MTSAEMQAVRDRCKVLAADGSMELFKVTKNYDGTVGRQQHHFPSSEELPAKFQPILNVDKRTGSSWFAVLL